MPAPPVRTLPADAPPGHHDASGADPRQPRHAGRLLAGLLVAVVAVTAAITLTDLRIADATATAAAQRADATQLVGDLAATRLDLDDHLRAADHAAATTLRHHVAVIAGGPHDTDLVAAELETLRAEADGLAAVAARDLPERPGGVPVAAADPVFERASDAQERAEELAADLHAAADDAEALDASLREVHGAAADHLDGSSLASSDEPDAVAAVWRDELDLLAAYTDALRAIDPAVAATDLAPLVEVQEVLAAEMTTIAERAVELLEDGDLDAYGALLEERLGEDDLLGSADALRDARTTVSADLLDGPLAETRSRSLALRLALGDLRDDASGLLAR